MFFSMRVQSLFILSGSYSAMEEISLKVFRVKRVALTPRAQGFFFGDTQFLRRAFGGTVKGLVELYFSSLFVDHFFFAGDTQEGFNETSQWGFLETLVAGLFRHFVGATLGVGLVSGYLLSVDAQPRLVAGAATRSTFSATAWTGWSATSALTSRASSWASWTSWTSWAASVSRASSRAASRASWASWASWTSSASW